MKLATFRPGAESPRVGVVSADMQSIIDAVGLAKEQGASAGPYLSMLALIEAGPEALNQLKDWVNSPSLGSEAWLPIASVALDAPIPRPPRLRCFSVYEKHLVNAFKQVLRHKLGRVAFAVVNGLGLIKAPKRFFKVPAYYKGNHLAVTGPGQVIIWPSYSRMLDYELELALVIGKSGKDIEVGDAPAHIFGYTIFNDFSARDALMEEMGIGPSAGPAKGKDFDTSNAIGPWIVTADELDNPESLAMTVSVNGVERGRARVGEMTHSISALIAFASRGETLQPGEVFSCGAVGGGTGIESWTFLNPGDRVDLSIEGIGTLTNTLGDASHFKAL